MEEWQAAGSIGELMPPPPKASGSASGEINPFAAPMAPIPRRMPSMAIPNYLWQSIVVTVLCCWPLGIPAIVYAAKVDNLVTQGRHGEALEASRSAKTWCWVAFWCGAAPLLIFLLAGAVGALSER